HSARNFSRIYFCGISTRLDATWHAFPTSFQIEHIARAAVSLPAAGEPVWYSFHAGSRRAEASSILLRYCAILLIGPRRAPRRGIRRGAIQEWGQALNVDTCRNTALQA